MVQSSVSNVFHPPMKYYDVRCRLFISYSKRELFVQYVQNGNELSHEYNNVP